MPDDSRPYVDTSALAKWYLNEARSEDVAEYLVEQSSLVISRLTVVEFQCLLARRRRAKELVPRMEQKVLSTFEQQIRDGFISVYPLDDRHAVDAAQLLTTLHNHPLRTLDALHLAIARSLELQILVTADRVLATAAAAVGLQTVRFD
jgi:predicted nucleic acid-binding protein